MIKGSQTDVLVAVSSWRFSESGTSSSGLSWSTLQEINEQWKANQL